MMSQMTSEKPVVQIEYSQKTQEALNALYELKENPRSTPEALEICWRAIECVPSGYTGWHQYLTTLKSFGWIFQGMGIFE